MKSVVRGKGHVRSDCKPLQSLTFICFVKVMESRYSKITGKFCEHYRAA